jgi:hypothetical protein
VVARGNVTQHMARHAAHYHSSYIAPVALQSVDAD